MDPVTFRQDFLELRNDILHSWTCKACGKTGISRSYLAEHLEKYHWDSQKLQAVNFHCNSCDIVFKEHPNYTSHRRNFHYDAEKTLASYVATFLALCLFTMLLLWNCYSVE